MTQYKVVRGMRFWLCMILNITFLMITACTDENAEIIQDMKGKTLDLSSFSKEKPQKPINLLFIHHSTGGQLLADKGPERGKDCIYSSHPNGGGLRNLLSQNNYIVHEASYNSLVGDKTDICHWNAKFRDHMEEVLTCNKQDEFFADGTRNHIVLFKSCFPNSYIESEGSYPGDPDSCQKTLTNYKAVYNSLRDYFANQPNTLFVVITAPPLVEPRLSNKGRIKEAIKALLGRQNTIAALGNRIRRFNNWLKDVEGGWLKGYPHKNIIVFDYYDILTDQGRSNWALYPSGDGNDDHPNNNGNMKAAQALVPFLNQAVHRMGW